MDTGDSFQALEIRPLFFPNLGHGKSHFRRVTCPPQAETRPTAKQDCCCMMISVGRLSESAPVATFVVATKP
jgi:hypothetical protein